MRTRAKLQIMRLLVLLLLLVAPLHARVPGDCRQLIVSVADTWDSTSGVLQRYEREGRGWKPVGAPWRVLFGRNGLAWGRGVFGQEQLGRAKMEKDGCAPAGIFRVGKIYTHDRSLPAGADYPFHTVTAADAWVDDVDSPDYNRHLVVDPKNPPPWFAKQRMRVGDFAYRWLVEVRHNSDPPVRAAGSAIFFHIRRGPSKPSAGCTTMAEADLVTLIKWLRAPANPHYTLLPRAEYEAMRKQLGLP